MFGLGFVGGVFYLWDVGLKFGNKVLLVSLSFVMFVIFSIVLYVFGMSVFLVVVGLVIVFILVGVLMSNVLFVLFM